MRRFLRAGVTADQKARQSASELDAIELMADTSYFIKRHEKEFSEATYKHISGNLEQTALEALSGKAAAQGFIIDPRAVDSFKFKQIVRILKKVILSMGGHASVENLKRHILGGDESSYDLGTYQRLLLIMAVYNLGEIEGWNETLTLREVSSVIASTARGSSVSTEGPEEDVVESEAYVALGRIAQIYNYKPLMRFARNNLEPHD